MCVCVCMCVRSLKKCRLLLWFLYRQNMSFGRKKNKTTTTTTNNNQKQAGRQANRLGFTEKRGTQLTLTDLRHTHLTQSNPHHHHHHHHHQVMTDRQTKQLRFTEKGELGTVLGETMCLLAWYLFYY